MVVLICLIFSVLSTIDGYQDFANETLFWMVSYILLTNISVFYIYVWVTTSGVNVSTLNEYIYIYI